MKVEEAIKIIERIQDPDPWEPPITGKAFEALEMAIDSLKTIDQYKWERDVAILQLKELGYELGEKIRTDGDCVSRKAAIDELISEPSEMNYGFYYAEKIKALPSAQPEIIQCKDCKHLQKWRSEESAKKFGQIYECRKGVLRVPVPDDFCSKAERRIDE